MKRSFLRLYCFLLFILTSGCLLSQKPNSFKVTLSSGLFLKNLTSISASGTRIFKADKGVLMAYKEGYITYAKYIEDIFAQDSIKDFNIELSPFKTPEFNGKLKRLAFTELLDKTSKLTNAYSTYGGYGYYNIGVNLKSADFPNAINREFRAQGFSAVEESNAVFKERQKAIDLAIAAEILTYNKETKGTPGFETQLMVKWSVFDPEEEKVVYSLTTGGYSNTGTQMSEKQALILSLVNSLNGLMINPDFQKLVQASSPGTEIKQEEQIDIPVVARNSFSEYSEMIQSSIKSAVTVKTDRGHGSGFIISSNGYILTNYHVISAAERIEIIFDNDMTLPATLVAKDKNCDVAVLKVQAGGFKALPIDTTDIKGKLGIDVIAIGTPEDVQLGQTVTKGIISGFRIFNDHKYIQTDVSINAGNSGGALINKHGEVVGIVAAKLKGDNIEGLGFAIPIRDALKALNIKLK